MVRSRGAAAVVVALAGGVLLGVGAAGGVSAQAQPALAISISGNHFVNQDGQTITLHGVDEESTEYACYDGYAYSSGPLDATDAAAIASWHANAVRVPLNEDCWLGINGEPAYGSQAGYQQAIEDYVQDLNADGIYAILDLHWSADGTQQSDGQREMPDGHSQAFWASVATTFESDPAVLFDIFNEPEGNDDNGGFPVNWSCWENGGCTVPNNSDDSDAEANPPTYTATGMQALVTAIRNTGATQPIMIGGLNYANDLTGWLANEPTDPDNQLAASFHNYQGENCQAESCWSSQIAPVAAVVPVVTGEFDEDCPVSPTDPDFDNQYMDWADQNGVSYLAWGWVAPDTAEPCMGQFLITDSSDDPANPNGVDLQDHLAALTATTTTTTSGTTTTAPPTTTTTTTTTTAPPTTTTTTTTTPSTTTASTPSTTSTTPATTTTTTPPKARLPLQLKITACSVKHGRVTLSATLAGAFSGRLRIRMIVTIVSHHRDRTEQLSASAAADKGRFKTTLRLPAKAKLKLLTLSYVGGPVYAPTSASVRSGSGG
jgi:endoglucanase